MVKERKVFLLGAPSLYLFFVIISGDLDEI